MLYFSRWSLYRSGHLETFFKKILFMKNTFFLRDVFFPIFNALKAYTESPETNHEIKYSIQYSSRREIYSRHVPHNHLTYLQHL